MLIDGSCSGHNIYICYIPFYVRQEYQQEADDGEWVMEVRDGEWVMEIVIMVSFDHFPQVTSEVDLSFPPKFPC